MAVNGLSERVSVVHQDAALLQRGREVRPLGCNLALADCFDAGTCNDCTYTAIWMQVPLPTGPTRSALLCTRRVFLVVYSAQ